MRPTNRTSLLLWTAQGLLALVFLFAGGVKLVMPLETLAKMTPLPGAFLRFIAVCELTGALGLILPGLLRIRPGLTPLAATGLVIIMAGATTTMVAMGQIATALQPLVVGCLAAFVAYGRWKVVPIRSASAPPGDTPGRQTSTGPPNAIAPHA